MKLETKFLIIVLIAIALSVPVAFAMKHRSSQLKFEKTEANQLKLKLDSKQKEVELKQQQIQEEQNKNIDLQKQLQTKKENEAKIAQAPQPPKAPVVTSAGNCEAYRGLVSQYAWDVRVAMAVMQAESGCRPDAVSSTCDRGLMQINCVHSAKVGGNLALLNDPATNIRVAFQVYSGAGWRAWTVYKTGAYLKYLG